MQARSLQPSKLRVVMTGPLPPALGGMASVVAALGASSLAQQTQLVLFDTGKQTPEGRSLWQGMQARLSLMLRWWRILGAAPGSRTVAHLHTCSGLTFFLDGLLLWLARLRGVPGLLHIHGARFDDFLDGLAPPLRWLARHLARSAAVVVVLSEEWRERLAGRLPGARLAVVQNGVPRPALPSLPPDSTRGAEVRFLFLGNLCRRKGVDVLIQAAALARENWRVELAGGEEEPGYHAIAAADIARWQVAERVSLLGPKVGAQKDALLASASGFVLPSLAEGLPMALLEAMAARLPVVVTRVGAMPEVVRAEVEGLLVAPGDAPALAAALDRLAADAALRARLGAAAEHSYEAGYGVERMVGVLMPLYDAALEARRP